ncbi:BTAD domain-containing putative transcriptional regulator [Rhizohabitans arisaemae]|uniref:BTAD domain-containing putative transcriptional regulator n=1 Tax=Rhizohabitans arisaemae TaxID=2720610 RepID=UPI0024B15301|nr:BTAD domain-containing putative transcriptional regulator [Rhizohabitans arisaemae]
MDFLVLGALTITHNGRSTAPKAAKDRAFLGELLAHPGEPISSEHLADVLWPDRLPADPANAVQVRASRLRALLRSVAGEQGEQALRTRSGGYELDLTHADTDLGRLQEAMCAAEAAATDEQAASLLAGGLALRRGEPFSDVSATPCVQTQATHAQEVHLAAIERYADLVLSGQPRPATLIADLTALATRHPLREPLHHRLMRLLRAAGRPAEALTVYERLRTTLRDELGTDPGPELRALHQEILAAGTADETQEPAPVPPSGTTGGNTVPAGPLRRLRRGPRWRTAAVAAVCLLGLGAATPLLSREGNPSAPRPPEPVLPVPGDRSRLDADVTYPDGSPVKVGERFTKAWKLSNIGTVPWRDRHLYRQYPWEGEDLCRTPRSVPIPDTDPGEAVLVSVPVQAPGQPGMCKVYWKMVDVHGNQFFPHLSGIFFDVRVVP